MKILGILGSPRTSGNTSLLLDAVMQGAQDAGAQVEIVSVAGMNMHCCAACGKCYATGSCIFEDDIEAVKAKMLEADGIVLASPNYMLSVTAQLKTIMDRCSLFVHCFMLKDKYGAAVATAGGGGEDKVAEYENMALQLCGAQTVGMATALGAGVGALVDQDAALAQATALGQDLVAAITEKRQYPDQAEAHAAFFPRMKGLVTAMAEKCAFQREYWANKGWLSN